MPRKSKDQSQKSPSWRSISQKSSRNTSAHSLPDVCSFNLKRLAKLTAVLAPIFFLIIALYCFNTGSLPGFLAAVSPKVQTVQLQSNGPLRDAHLKQLLDPCYNESIMHLDLRLLKAQLESIPQVQSASIKRSFPNTLEVHLNEHQPLLRALVLSPDSQKPSPLFISTSGHIFRPYAYSADFAKSLPFLSGIQLAEATDGSFLPIPQIQAIHQFISATREYYPALTNNIHAISAKYLFYPVSDFGSFFTLKTKNNIEIVINVGDYPKQLGRLQTIISRSPKERLAAIKRIDLSQPNQATIQHNSPNNRNFS